jgi:hypothetical protein
MKPRMRTYAQLAFALSLSLAALACGGGEKKPAAEPTPVAATPVTPAVDPAAKPAPGAGGDASCEQVADHVIEIVMASDDYKNAKPEEQKMAQDMMPQVRGQIVQECTDKKFTAEVKTCVLDSKSMKEMEACDVK